MLRSLRRPAGFVALALLFPLGLPAGRTARADLVLTADGQYVRQSAEDRLLGSYYADDAVSHDLAVGFRVRLPAKVRIFQRKGLELMSFVQDDKKWGGTVEMVTFTNDDPSKPPPADISAFIKRRPAMLPARLKAQQVIDSHLTTISKRPAAKLTLTVEASNDEGGKLAMLRQELAVQVDPNQYLVLTMYSPLNSRDDAVATFDAMAGTFTVTDRKDIIAHRTSAAEAGTKWLDPITPEQTAQHIINDPQLFRVLVDGRDVGYLAFNESVSTMSGYKGLQVLVTSRTFPEDGSIVTAHTQTFWAFDKQDAQMPLAMQQMATWNRQVVSALTVTGVTETKSTTEEGILTHAGGNYKLDVTRSAANNRGEAIPDSARTPFHFTMPAPVADATPHLLPKVLEYLWPRLVDLTKPQRMAFAVYNSQLNRLSLRTVTIGAPEKVIIGPKSYDCIRLEDDLDPGSTTMWALRNGPETGRIIAMRTSDGTVLIPTTMEKMQQIWKSRLDQVKQGAAKP